MVLASHQREEPEGNYSGEEPMASRWHPWEEDGLKLKLQYFGHLMQRTDSLEKILMLGKLKVGGEGDDRG